MIIKFGKKTKVSVIGCLLLLMGCLGGIFVYYLNSGLLNGSYVSSIYEASADLNNIQKVAKLDDIESHVLKDDVPSGIKIFNTLTEKINHVNNIDSIDMNALELESAKTEVKMILNSLVSLTSLTSIIDVLEKKVSRFTKFAASNNWRTLTRISKRLGAKLGNNEVYSIKKISLLLRNVKQDISIMRNITESSVLSRAEKTSILMRLKALQTEIKMLGDYRENLVKFSTSFSKYRIVYNKWLEHVSPEISFHRLGLEKKAKVFVFLLLGTIGLILFMVVFLIFMFRKTDEATASKIEKTVLEIMNEGVAQPHDNYKIKGSRFFISEIQKTKSYIQKRMKFGSIFQTSIPFSSLLLDSNLKVIWANQELLKTWNIEERQVGSDAFSWDYISRYTNLGTNDPVIEAFKNDLAGIYQIQVKTGQDDSLRSYELYVRPVKEGRERFIMLFFYPLEHMEETILNQGKTLVSPIEKALNSLIDDDISELDLEMFRNEFEVAEIDEIYTKFCQVAGKYLGERELFLKEISELESSLLDQRKINQDMERGNREIGSKLAGFNQGLDKMKQLLIKLAESSESYADLSIKQSKMSEELLGTFKATFKLAHRYKESIDSFIRTLNDLKKEKTNLKEIKEETNTSSERFVKAVDNGLVFQKSNQDPKLENIFSKLKSESKRVSKQIEQMDKVLTLFDVKLAKIDMLTNQDRGEDERDLGEIGDYYTSYQFGIEDTVSRFRELDEISEKLELEWISEIKAFYQDVKEAMIIQEQLADSSRERGVSIAIEPTSEPRIDA